MFDIGIVAHIDRLPGLGKLVDAVNPAHISIDDGALGCEGNHRHVWRALADGSSYWSVVLEDDAVPVPNFLEQLTSALQVAPAAIVSLYLGRSRPPQFQPRIARAVGLADAMDASFIVGNRLLHGVGVAIKTRLIPDMLDVTGTTACYGLPIDEAISAWARAYHYGVAYTWPSLVDHADGLTVAHHRDNLPRTPGRTAWRADGQLRRWNTSHIAM